MNNLASAHHLRMGMNRIKASLRCTHSCLDTLIITPPSPVLAMACPMLFPKLL